MLKIIKYYGKPFIDAEFNVNRVLLKYRAVLHTI